MVSSGYDHERAEAALTTREDLPPNAPDPSTCYAGGEVGVDRPYYCTYDAGGSMTSRTRERIIDAADDLFYRRGFEHTSFTDIAEAVQITRGNFYYHFKTKDQILDAVIERRVADTQAMLDGWEREADEPAQRIGSFIQMWLVNRADIMRFGCPVGTLCAELAKLDHASREEAARLFTIFRAWLRRQFELLGGEDDADVRAMHLLAWSQGVASLANAFHDEKFIELEVQQLSAWLRGCAESRP